MPRPLTEAEKFFILNSDKSDAEVAAAIQGVGEKTVSKFREENTVVVASQANKVSDSLAESATEQKPPADRFAIPEQADPAVLERLRQAQEASIVVDKRENQTPPPQVNPNAGLKVDDLLGRRRKPDGSPDRSEGIVVMTPAAAELSDDRNYRRPYKENDAMPDARDVLAVKKDPNAGSRNRNRIHKIRPNEPSQ